MEPAPSLPDVLDLNALEPDRRAESVRRAVRFLSPGEEILIRGTGDYHRYAKVLDREFPWGVSWQAVRTNDDGWLATIRRAAA